MEPLSFEARLAGCSVEVTRADYERRAGIDPAADLTAIYARHAGLFRAETVSALVQAPNDAASRALARLAVTLYRDAGLVELTERLRARRLEAVAELETGERVEYPYLRGRIAVEPHPKRRRDLEAARLEVERALNPLRAQVVARELELVAALGCDDAAACLDRLRALHLDALAPLLDQLLEATDDVYRRGLRHYLGRLGVPEDEALPADLAHLFRAPQYDNLLSAARLLPVLRATLAGLGLPLDGAGAPVLDAEPRPRKTALAFCAPIDPPGEVVVSVQPVGGRESYVALFDAAGRAMQLASDEPALPFALRRHGDDTLLAASGRLFAVWLRSPRWLRDRLGVRLNEVQEYLELAHFHALYELRRLVAQLRFELALYAGETGTDKLFADLMAEHTCVRPHPADYLLAVEAGLESAVRLRAASFEVQLRRRLEATVGEDWFTRVEGGQALLTFWQAAPAATAEELANGFGASGLEVEPLVEDLLEPRD